MYIEHNKFGDLESTEKYEMRNMLRAVYGQAVAYKGLAKDARLAYEGHYMDPSTGTIREMVTLFLTNCMKYKPAKNEPAYDGYRIDPMHTDDEIEYIETKPILANPEGPAKKAGTGCINDHTFSRHERFLQDNLVMQSSTFFSDGILGFVIEFPYADIADHMEMCLIKTKNSRGLGKFSFKTWHDKNVKVTYLNKSAVEKNRNKVPGGKYKNPATPFLYHWLMDHDNNMPDI